MQWSLIAVTRSDCFVVADTCVAFATEAGITLASKAITANVRSEGSLIVLMLRRKKLVPFRLIVLLRNLPVLMLDWLYHLMERRSLTETDFVPSSVAVTVTF